MDEAQAESGPDTSKLDSAASPSRRLDGCVTVAGLLVAAGLYLVSLLLLIDLGGGDGLSRAIGQLVAMAAHLLAWLMLGLVVLTSLAPARVPGKIMALGIALVLCGAAGSLTAIGMMSRPSLLVLPPLLLPPLVASFGFWARTQAQTRKQDRVALAFALVAVPLIAAPFVAYADWRAGEPGQARWAREQAEAERHAATEAAADTARFRALGPQSRLDDALPFLATGRDEETLAVIRSLNSGEADAARLLDAGTELTSLDRIHEFGFTADPALCRAYRAWLDAKLRDTNPARPAWQSVPFELQSQLPNLRWFMANNCDVSDQIRNLGAAVRMLPPDWDLGSFGGDLDAILRAPAVGR